jgi:ABC-type antimicrobial peptide transport system permease subunit
MIFKTILTETLIICCVGGLFGNLLAFSHLFRGRVDPEHVLNL